MKGRKALFSSATDEWATPLELFKSLNDIYHFTLDPCANSNNFKCEKWFDKKSNGLLQDWQGERVFCNPPYGKEIKTWVEKCYKESLKPNTLVVLLISARTDTAYFHDFIYHKAELRFIRGRLKFGDSKQNAPFPSMLAIFDNRL